MNQQAVIDLLCARLEGVLAIYAFGSRIRGEANEHSDLDLAVLVEGYAEPVALWRLAGELEDVVGCPVDLLDLRNASTVMQQQVIVHGERWWVRDERAGLFECAMLSEKLDLDAARAPLLRIIEQEGRVYGR